MTNQRHKFSFGGRLFAGALWMLLWQVCSVLVARPALVPSPLHVGQKLLQLAVTGQFWAVLATSLARISLGFLLALLLGTVMGVLCAKFRTLSVFFSPMLRIISTTPIASFIILASLLIRSSHITTVITFLMTLPLIWNNVYQGFLHLDRQRSEMLRVFRVPAGRQLAVYVLPGLFPYLSAGISAGMGIAWKSGIAAEVIALPQLSIGKQIYEAKLYFEIDELFAWTVAVIVLSVLLDHLSRSLLKKITKLVRMGGK